MVPGNLFELRRYLWAEKPRVAAGGLLLLVSMGAGLYLPMMNRSLFDEVLPSKDVARLLVVGGIIFLLSCVEFGSRSVSRLFLESAALKITASLRGAVFRKLTRVCQRDYEARSKGELHDILTHDTKNLRLLHLDRLVQLLISIMAGGQAWS